MIIVRIWDGLGNQMFQYAYARSLKEKGLDVRLDLNKSFDQSFGKYSGHDKRSNQIQNFNISIPEASGEELSEYSFLSRTKISDRIRFALSQKGLCRCRLYEETSQAYSEQSASLNGNYYVKGWFQSERYFSGISGILHRELTLKNDPGIPKELDELLEGSRPVVSLHARRGDYVKVLMALPAVYYQKAIEYMKTVFSDPVFLVFSDDPEWVMRKLDIEGNFKYIGDFGRYKDYEELVLMSRCSAHIISNSTFSWWGAWLDEKEDKIVVAPKKWFEGQKDIVPKEWTII